MDHPNSRIIQLAGIVGASVNELNAALEAQNILSPSFDEDAPPSLPKNTSDLQNSILNATAELQDLLLDPTDLIVKYGGHNNMVCLQAISRFNIAGLVPKAGQIHFSQVAAQTGLTYSMTCRLLRHAMTMRIFCEPEPDMVAHTKVSKALRAPHLNSWLACGSHEMWPAAVKMIDAASLWPDSQDPSETAFSLAHGKMEPTYQAIHENPERSMRFSGAMRTFAENPRHSATHVIDSYDWASLGCSSVVDIGGGRGHIATALTSHFPKLKITVQDIAKVVAGAEAELPATLKDRVEFMSHDIFLPQTLQADVYYIRWVLHNWPDSRAIEILRAQVPMLRNGVRILLNEICMPKPGAVDLWQERNLRAADLNMGAVFNAQERTLDEWKALLGKADPRFVFLSVGQSKGSALAMIEVGWDGNLELLDTTI